ncbi:DMT family transporter [Rhodoligotrophos defluvii]|uniref:DMT family transporter n=1 Tax=Rhodoligotrophos defluvii TaxID=2561934 RepID=UPI0010C991F5|nr:DMT family transporter [Rhodoligotrophos defluvii]
MQSKAGLRGVLTALAAYLMFPMHDALVKWLVADYSIWQIMFFRSAVIMVLLLAWQGPGLVARSLRSPMRGFLVLRALLLIGAWSFYYSAARFLGLGELTTIYFASPILVAVLAVPLLGEAVSTRKWLAIGLGFLGVVIACRPDIHVGLAPVLMGLAAAVLWALAVIVVRMKGVLEPVSVNLAVANLGFIILGGVAMPWSWVTPDLSAGALFIVAGLVSGLGQFLIFEAIRRVPASTSAPLGFSSLIWAFMLGYLVWGDVPSLTVVAGAILIVLSGILICALEWRSGSAAPVRGSAG